MNGMLFLAKRNVTCYFRDRASVVFSLMAVIIVVMLYLLFLRNMLVSSYPDMDGIFICDRVIPGPEADHIHRERYSLLNCLMLV